MKGALRYAILIILVIVGLFIGRNYFSPCQNTSYGTLIILHGISSSGKSSTAKALQNIFAQDNQPYLYISMDEFLKTLPKKWVNLETHAKNVTPAPDALQLIQHYKPNDANPYIKLIFGPVAEKALQGIIHTLLTLTRYGNNVIFDGAFPNKFFKDVMRMKRCMPLYIIGIQVDLKTAEERERKRNGFIGLARGLAKNPDYSYDKYDLVVNTTDKTPEQAAQEIKNFIDASAQKQ